MNRIPFENSKFEKVRIRFLISEKVKSKIQVSEAKSQNEAQYPFFTSGENILSFDKFLCDDETIFLNTGGNASVKFYNGKASYSTDTYAIESKNQNYCLTKFLFYCLNDTKFINDTFFEGSALKHLQKDKFKNFRIPLPPLAEQERIAEFLDKKCASIDSSIENLEQKTKSLAEYKKALITQCVTKGLNPKILEFKDSEIPWIGQIPKHWEVRPLYYFFKERKNKNLLGKEKNLLSLSYGKIIRKDIETKYGLLPENFNAYNIIEKDDIVFRFTDLQNDKVSLRTGLVCEKGIITSAYITITPKRNICVSFYHYLLHCYDLMKVFYNFGNGVRQGLTYKELSKMKILVPPLNEQKEIAEILDKKCEKIDNLSANYKEQIKTLKEYKQALIYECVTGKKQI